MEYKVNGAVILVSDILEPLQKGYMLHACKIIQEKSGCSLAEARDLCHKVIKGEGIRQNPLAVEIQAYMQAEYEDGD